MTELRLEHLKLGSVFSEHVTATFNELIRLTSFLENQGSDFVKSFFDLLLGFDHFELVVRLSDTFLLLLASGF